MSAVKQIEWWCFCRWMRSYTTGEHCLIQIEIPQFRRLIQKQFSKDYANNIIQSLHLATRSWMIKTCAFMQCFNSFKILLNSIFSQILFIICEYFLWYVIMKIDFVVNEFSNSILSCLGNSLCNRPICCIIDCSDNSSIAIACRRQSSYQIYSPSLKWLNKCIDHQLRIFFFLWYMLALMNLIIGTCCDELT